MIAGAAAGTLDPVVTLPFLVGAATGVGAGTETGDATGDATGGDTGGSMALHEKSISNAAKRLSTDGHSEVTMFSNVSLERKLNITSKKPSNSCWAFDRPTAAMSTNSERMKR